MKQIPTLHSVFSKKKSKSFHDCKTINKMSTLSSLVCSSKSTHIYNKKKKYEKDLYSLNKRYTRDLKKQNTLKKKRNISTSYSSNKKIKGRLAKLYISSTKNNTILTLTDTRGNTQGWGCSGSLGFKNARKSTTYAAQGAAESMVKKAKSLGYTHLRLLVKGLGRGKRSCVRALSKSGLKIVTLEDKTGIPYNGCRAPRV